jgi:hypothetical protein
MMVTPLLAPLHTQLRDMVPIPQPRRLAFVHPSQPIERESGDAYERRPVQALSTLERWSRRRPRSSPSTPAAEK